MSTPPTRAWTLIAALSAPPAAWAAQLVTSYAVAGRACFPGVAPHSLGVHVALREHVVLAALSGLCLIVALVSGVVAVRARERWPSGAARFLANCAVLDAMVFAIAIGFGATVSVAVPACWQFLR